MASTIDPNVPVPGSLVEESGPAFRANWQRAINDINALIGGGGGGGSNTVATKAALAALAIPVGASSVYLADTVIGGMFMWSLANMSAAVAADPEQGLFVAPSSASSGSSGAWVRMFEEWMNAKWFGFVGDGVVNLVNPPYAQGTVIVCSYTTQVVSGTDNSIAWLNMLQTMRYLSSLGVFVKVNFPPGSYNFNLDTMATNATNGVGGFYGIRKLHIKGYEAVFTNTYNETVSGSKYTGQPWLYMCNSLVTGPNWAGDGVIAAGPNQPLGFLINDVQISDKQVVLQTPARTSYFNIGEWVMIAGLDIQMSGFPFNAQFNQRMQILDINASTGAITMVQASKYQILSTFTDFIAPGAPEMSRCGKARIWKLDTTGYGYGNQPNYWDLDHTYEGIQVNIPPGALGGVYTSLVGRRFTTINWKGAGFSESLCDEHIAIGDHYWGGTEIDKDVGHLVYRNCVFEFGSVAQSSSVEKIEYYGCIICGLGTGAKETVIDNCEILPNVSGGGLTNVINFGAKQGGGGVVSIRNSKLETYLPNIHEPLILDGTTPFTISTDGSTPITYANGQFILNKANAAGLPVTFSGLPGQYVVLVPADALASQFPGDIGVGLIMSYTEDATNLYMNTTLPYATLPAFAVSGVQATMSRVFGPSVLFQNCNGSDQARLVSEANANGYDYWNYKTYTINGLATPGRLAGWQGNVIAADIEVIRPSANVNDVINFSWPGRTPAVGGFVNLGNVLLQINCGVAGRRIVTQNAFIGKAPNDFVSVNAVTQPYLPTNALAFDLAQWGANSFGSNLWQSPLIKATFMFDTGQLRKVLTTQFHETSSGVMLPVQGTLV
ncbi:MAG TPA: hypothetical protein VGF39_15750 [Stellaceae bacterium]|jgi:hypothetical protein